MRRAKSRAAAKCACFEPGRRALNIPHIDSCRHKAFFSMFMLSKPPPTRCRQPASPRAKRRQLRRRQGACALGALLQKCLIPLVIPAFHLVLAVFSMFFPPPLTGCSAFPCWVLIGPVASQSSPTRPPQAAPRRRLGRQRRRAAAQRLRLWRIWDSAGLGEFGSFGAAVLVAGAVGQN